MKTTPLFATMVIALGFAIAAPAQATVTQLSSPSELSSSDSTLSTFGTIGATASSPLSYSVGGNTLTFTDAGVFEFDQAGTNYFSTAFPDGTNVLYAAGFSGAGAPITLSFAKPITEFGFNAEEFNFGPYTMYLTAYEGATSLGTFSADGDDPGSLSFLGLRASGGTSITSITISDNNGNNIGLGPVTFGGTPTSVPEPGSLMMFGAGLIGLGLVLFERRRRWC
jgi:hypothetical protein